MPTKSEIRVSLAKAIKDAIAVHEGNIAKNIAKEALGLDKLSKNVGQPGDPSMAGATTGTPTVDVPNMKAEKRPGETWASDNHVTRRIKARAAKNNKVAESKAQEVEKGALPMDGGLGKGEEDFDNDQAAPCTACNGPLVELGVLGNMAHSVCRNCGLPHATPHQENVEAIDNAPAQGMVKGEVKGLDSAGNTQQKRSTFAGSTLAHNKGLERGTSIKNVHATPRFLDMQREAAKNNKQAEHAASKVEKAEIPQTQSAPDKSLPNTKEPPEKGGKTVDSEGSGGDINKPKDLTKGAIESMVRQAKAKAGFGAHENVPAKGFPRIPAKTNPISPPPKSPNFGKAALSEDGVGREVAIKTGALPSRIPSSSQLRNALDHKSQGYFPGRARPSGGVQSQIAAVKKPLIPMVNSSGPVAKAEKRPGEGWITTRNNPANKHPFAFSSYQSVKDVERAKKNNKVAESKAQEVEKAEKPSSSDNRKAYLDKMAASKFNPKTAKVHDSKEKMDTLFGKDPKVLHPSDNRKMAIMDYKLPPNQDRPIHKDKVQKAEPGAALPKSPMSKPAGTAAPKAPTASAPKVSKL